MPMRQPFALLAVLAVASAGPLHAQTPPAPGEAAMVRPLLGLADARSSVGRPYAAAFAPTPRPGDGSPTAIDYSLAPEGLAASVGFVCDNDGHIPQTHGANALAGSEPGRLIGTTLRVGF